MSLLDSFKSSGPDAAPDTGRDSSDFNFDEVKAKFFKSGKGKRKSEPVETDIQPDAKLLNDLFRQENWEEIAALYFNTRFAMTGDDGFLLNREQKAILGATMATSMRLLIKIDPKWISLIVFGVNYVTLIGQKEIEHKANVIHTQGKGSHAVS